MGRPGAFRRPAVFAGAHDVPVVILFILLALIYLSEIPAKFAQSAALARVVGLWRFLGGIWLMYLTYATAINLSLGARWWL